MAASDARIPPHNREAEEGLIGWILNYPERFTDITELLTDGASVFHVDELRDIYTAMLRLDLDGKTVDAVTVSHKLGDDSDATWAKLEYLRKEAPIAVASGYDYAEMIRELAALRIDLRLGEDLADAAARGGASYAVTRAAILDGLTYSAGDDSRSITVMHDDEAESMPPLRGILGDILYDESLSYLYAPSGRWKTFIALDWSMCISTGKPWMGKPTVEGDVVYVCSEGARGLGKRITAWKQRHGVTGRTRLRVVPAAIELTNAAQVASLARRLDALDVHPVLIVIDTLAASNPGDENTAENAGAITRVARRIIQKHDGACVLIVHHTGYDAAHMRGSSALYANADTVIRIEGGDANRRIEPGEAVTLSSDKAKDGEPFHDIHLTAEVQRWADDSGAIHSSLVMTPCDAPAPKANGKVKGWTAKRQAALDVLPPDGLHYADYQRVSGISNPTSFSDFLKWAIALNSIERTEDGIYRPLAATVTTLRYALPETVAAN